MSNYIGIDLGTSGVKILLVSKYGKILNEVTEIYPISCPKSGWSEQNPADWYSAVISGLKKLNAKEVAGLSCGGQMHGLVILDAKDEVIRPCILWNDGRTGKQTDYLNTVLGKEKLAEITANIAFAGFTAPKLLWLKENEPQNFNRIAKIMLPKDYIVYRLTGEFATDYSDASGTLLLDVENRRWSEEMCAFCDIDCGQLPKLYESYAPVGYMKKSLSDKLGWGKVTVSAGAGDNAAAAVGTGTVKGGECNLSLGTSGTLFVANDGFSLPKNNALHSFCHANGRYHYLGCILSAASANKWWIEDILNTNYELALKAEGKTGKNEVIFLPYLTGERCPHNDVDARGAFIGISALTTREDMALAVLEGVAFAFRDCLEIVKGNGLEITRSTVCGGGARSALWQKILSNVLNLNLYTAETGQGPAFGAAILAMVACGEYKSVEDAVPILVKTKLSVTPQKELVEAYDKKYGYYKQLYPLLKSIH